jgi:flagellar hook-length control protein FliK
MPAKPAITAPVPVSAFASTIAAPPVTGPADAQDAESAAPGIATESTAGAKSPAHGSRTPLPSFLSAHVQGAFDSVGSIDGAGAEPPGRSSEVPGQAGSRAAPAATPDVTEFKGDGRVDSDPTTPPISDGPAATNQDANPANGPAAMGSQPAVRPHVDPASTLPFGPATPDRAPSVEIRSIPVDVGAPQWPKAVAAELVMLGHQKVESATLRLSPEHLGHIEVQIHLEAKVINLTFGAAHAETRNALEHALPQLRDGFAQAGLTLGEATVQQQMRQESQNDTVMRPPESGVTDEVIAKSEYRQSLSLIDEYA